MGTGYRHAAIRQLKDQQARFAPAEDRLAQIDRAEALLAEIDPARRYPYEYLWYRIKGFRPETSPELVLDGEGLRHDLRTFIEDLSATLDQPAELVPEPVLTVESVSRRYNVSSRTIARWRRQGLVARRFLIDGKDKVGFLESSVSRFVADHQAQVERGTRFRQLSDEERDEIIRRARRMAGVGQSRLAEIARRIARKMGRAPETIRTTLKAYDRDHPDRAIFPTSVPPLDEAARPKSIVSTDAACRPRSSRPSTGGRAPASIASSTRCVPCGCWTSRSSRCRTPASTTRRNTPRSWAPSPSRPTAKPHAGRKRPKGCRPTWPASTRCPCWPENRRRTCSAR